MIFAVFDMLLATCRN